MTKTNGARMSVGTIAHAAGTLDTELARFEELAAAVHKVPLSSEKNLDRAAKGTEEVLACQERIGACVSSLVEAITLSRERQQRIADDLETRAHEIRARREEYRALLERFLGVSDEARALNAIMSEIAEHRAQTSRDGPTVDVRAQLAEAIVRMDKVADSAKTLEDEARVRDMEDLRRQAEALRQQLQSAKNRVLLIQRAL